MLESDTDDKQWRNPLLKCSPHLYRIISKPIKLCLKFRKGSLSAAYLGKYEISNKELLEILVNFFWPSNKDVLELTVVTGKETMLSRRQ